MAEEYIFEADISAGRLRRDLFFIKGRWNDLRRIIDREIENADNRITSGLSNDRIVDQLWQDIKVIFESMGRRGPDIEKAANKMLNDISAFKQGLGKE